MALSKASESEAKPQEEDYQLWSDLPSDFLDLVASRLSLVKDYPPWSNLPSDLWDSVASRLVEDYRPWFDLPLELLNLVASRLSLADRIRFPTVCKNWSLIYSPIRNAKRWPWLMYLPKPTEGEFKFFDPIDDKIYRFENKLCSDGYVFCALRFAKDAWVLISDEVNGITLFEPTGDGRVNPPYLPRHCEIFSFSSPPTSSNCIVFGISGCKVGDSFVHIYTWRYGDEEWSYQFVDNNLPFNLADNNPVFHNDLLYCLGRYGNLGVFDHKNKTWTVLDKPILSPSKNLPRMTDEGRERCYLVKSSKGELLSVFDCENGTPIVMRLDQSEMVWKKVKELEDEIIFVDVRSSISIPAPVKGTGNKIYFSKLYHNKFYPKEAPSGVTDSFNCVWVMPGMQNFIVPSALLPSC